MEKNKDTVPDEHLTLLENAEFEFLADMIKRANAASTPSPTNSIVSCHFLFTYLFISIQLGVYYIYIVFVIYWG